MAALEDHEVVPGTVVQIDADALRATGKAQCNAEVAADGDRAVQGEHSFLILLVDKAKDTVVMAPVFSKFAPGSEVLDEKLKSGYPDKWVGAKLHFNRWQHWGVRREDLVAYSAAEDTPVGARRMYAQNAPQELNRMLAFIKQNRAPWRTLK